MKHSFENENWYQKLPESQKQRCRLLDLAMHCWGEMEEPSDDDMETIFGLLLEKNEDSLNYFYDSIKNEE